MKSRSAKRQALYQKERIPLVQRLLEERPICEKCHRQRSVDVHEIKSRARGGSITDEANLACLCRRCHDWVTQHPSEASQQGWSRQSWE